MSAETPCPHCKQPDDSRIAALEVGLVNAITALQAQATLNGGKHAFPATTKEAYMLLSPGARRLLRAKP